MLTLNLNKQPAFSSLPEGSPCPRKGPAVTGHVISISDASVSLLNMEQRKRERESKRRGKRVKEGGERERDRVGGKEREEGRVRERERGERDESEGKLEGERERQ